MVRSGLISREMAFYMFGPYAIEIYENERLFPQADREGAYWKLFVDFYREVKAYGNAFEPEKFKF